MNLFALLCVLCGFALVVSAFIFVSRVRRPDPDLSLVVILVAATLTVFGVGSTGLYASQHESGPFEVRTETYQLQEIENGVHVAAYRGLLGPALEYRTADDSGWVSTSAVPFDRAQVREGDALTVEVETKTTLGGIYWPWPQEVEVSYVFTVPADAASGVIPSKG